MTNVTQDEMPYYDAVTQGGVVGGDTGDQTAATNAALVAATAVNKPLYFPPGTYRFEYIVSVPEGCPGIIGVPGSPACTSCPTSSSSRTRAMASLSPSPVTGPAR